MLSTDVTLKFPYFLLINFKNNEFTNTLSRLQIDLLNYVSIDINNVYLQIVLLMTQFTRKNK